MPIARDARAGVHDRVPAPDQPVEQRRLADVGPADDGDGGGAVHTLPFPTPWCGVRNGECGASPSIPHSALRTPHSLTASTKSYDKRTRHGTRSARSAAPMSA